MLRRDELFFNYGFIMKIDGRELCRVTFYKVYKGNLKVTKRL